MRIIALISGIGFLLLIISSTAFGQGVVDISIPAVSGTPGDTVTVPVNIGNTTGLEIIAVEVLIQYDSNVLSVIDADVSGTIARTWEVATSKDTPGEFFIVMIWSDPQGPLSGSGALVNVKFAVNATAQIGSTSQLHLDADRTRLNDGTPGVVTFDGIFTVANIPAGDRMDGDVNGDNRVDYLDLLKLVLMYNRASGDSGYDPAADFNSDGRINKDDMIILWRNFGSAR